MQRSTFEAPVTRTPARTQKFHSVSRVPSRLNYSRHRGSEIGRPDASRAVPALSRDTQITREDEGNEVCDDAIATNESRCVGQPRPEQARQSRSYRITSSSVSFLSLTLSLASSQPFIFSVSLSAAFATRQSPGTHRLPPADSS